ncbi:M3 family metallopeptidase [Luteimicrobium xylanilyticum]|uniref:Peptidyl-dipeptidase Dcp n=1 Tax=Luteimicrobium xylanilyticum TaxID=1133546 RepID=A0A5P9QAL4_9MICO|nr:M3 family metallopeptidase [Luteimicrobium xylanilyticum]QFU98160.1 Peptidyl-dipeptidase Dcp [Luteimicrobium xylanilyticum]
MPLDTANPFAAPSPLPYELPDFGAVRAEHYLPAARAGMAEQLDDVRAIATSSEPPTPGNVLDAFERTGQLLRRAATVFFSTLSADATPELEAIEAELAPELAAHEDAVFMDRDLYARFVALADRAAAGEVDLDDEQAWLLRKTLDRFTRAGVALDDAAQARLRELNTRLTSLEAAFGRTLLAASNAAAVLVTDRSDLAGLPDDAVAAAAQAARDGGHPGDDEHGPWLLELQLPTQQAVVATLDDADVRARVQAAAEARGAGGEHDTRGILVEIAHLRAEKARLLGYAHYADYVAADGTAGTGEAVADVLERLAPAAVANARREGDDLATYAAQAGLPTTGSPVAAGDWAYLSDRLRTARHDLDASALRPYLELERVLRDGVFEAARRLYGLTFAERDDLVGYHPDVRVFEVFDEATAGPGGGPGVPGEGIGLFLADYWTRASKRGGAWMNNLVDQNHLLDQRPVVVNNLNLPKPPAGSPTLLEWDNVITLFHEFGHALHGLFSDVRYPSRSGTEVPRDFVEYPSQVNEMWAWEPEILRSYAVHHVTGEPMPSAWVDTLLATRQWGEGFATTEYLAAALLDQAWHRLAPDDVPTDPADVATFEERALGAAGVDYAPVPPRYRSTYFNHVFGGGYAAGYYSYIWSEVLDADTVEWFRENGGLERTNGDRFRRTLLARGGGTDPMDAFRELRGREPEIAPLLARRGLA